MARVRVRIEPHGFCRHWDVTGIDPGPHAFVEALAAKGIPGMGKTDDKNIPGLMVYSRRARRIADCMKPTWCVSVYYTPESEWDKYCELELPYLTEAEAQRELIEERRFGVLCDQERAKHLDKVSRYNAKARQCKRGSRVLSFIAIALIGIWVAGKLLDL